MNKQKDTEDFFWYSSLWRLKGDRLAYLALLNMRDTRHLTPLILKQIAEIENQENETNNSRSLRSSSGL